jgi:hypothetical protein
MGADQEPLAAASGAGGSALVEVEVPVVVVVVVAVAVEVPVVGDVGVEGGVGRGSVGDGETGALSSIAKSTSTSLEAGAGTTAGGLLIANANASAK